MIRAGIGYSVLFLLFLTGAFFLANRVFIIRTIRVTGANIQLEINKKRLPKTLVFFPSAKLRSELLRENPALADLRFEKQYPGTLVVAVRLRESVAALSTGNRRVALDETGVVLGDEYGAGLPVIYATVPLIRTGQRIEDPRITQSLAFLAGMRQILPIASLTVADDGTIRANAAQLTILFTQTTPVPRTLATLQQLIAGFRIKGTLPAVIDVRFDKPIVTF